MVKFIFVKIAYRAPTIDGDHMPLWLYDRPLYVIKKKKTLLLGVTIITSFILTNLIRNI